MGLKKNKDDYQINVTDENGNTTMVSSKDLFNPKSNPTVRLDSKFSVELSKKLDGYRKMVKKKWD